MFFILIESLICEFDVAFWELGLVVGCFFEIEIDGVFLPNKLPIREVLSEFIRLPEVAAGCFITVGAEFFISIKSLVGELDLTSGEFDLAVGCFLDIEVESLLLLIELPISEVLSELIRLLGLAAGCFTTVGVEGFFVLMKPPILDIVLVADCLLEMEIDGVFLPIELPMREVLPELMPLLELEADCFPIAGAEKFFVITGLLIIEFELAVDCLPGAGTDGVLVLIVLPILDVIFEFMRPLEITGD